jgi:phosphoglycerate dehydrogenase-like enzyme
MSTTKVLLTKKFFSQDIQYFRERLLPEVELIDPEAYDDTTLCAHSKDVRVFLGGHFTEGMLKQATGLELIQIPWTGVDRLDFTLLRSTGAVVCNSHSNSGAVAEFSVALFLALLKKIAFHHDLLRQGNWNRPRPDQENPISPFSPMLSSMTVGIMGHGAIGSKVRQLLRGFDCRFAILSGGRSASLDDESQVFQSPDGLHDFLAISDVVFVCLPLTDSTRGMLGPEAIGHMKKGSFVVNTARGEIIDEAALFEACSSRHLAGAAIDTWWKPVSAATPSYPATLPFHTLDNVIMSSHRSGMVSGTLPHLDDAIANINRLVEGEPLLNQIDITRKY